ncbi:hypothetical protein CW748_02885 [Alteromonadales bacterium alter-6D02]|nr:hypothetical protein CW748_02885 [Alteromonadales bacterium alter-6D02]
MLRKRLLAHSLPSSRTRLAAAISLAILMAGCGSSNDSDEKPIVEEPLKPVFQSFSGKAADGYLVGALVCLDLNNDSICGSDEPNALTTDGGNYTFSDLDETIDLSQVRLLVKVIAGQTIDEDNPGETVSQSYDMSSPPGQIDFVSPITTLIDNQMQSNQEQTQEEAEEVVAQLIGIESDDDLDLTADYVEASAAEGERGEKNRRLHHVAQAIAGAIAVVTEDLKNQLDALDDGKLRDAKAAIINTVLTGLTDITTAIDQANANNEQVKIKDIINDLKDTIEIAEDELEDAIEQAKEEREARKTNIEILLTQQGGLFFLEQDKDYAFDESDGSCTVETSLSYGNFQVTDAIGQFSFQFYNPDTGLFEEISDDEDNDGISFYTLGQSGWTLQQEDQLASVSFSDDGLALTMTMPRDGKERITAREFDIVGKSSASVTRDNNYWRKALGNDFSFNDEAKAYFIKGEQLENYFILPIWQGCNDEASETAVANCNWVRFGEQQSEATTFEELITLQAPNDENMLAKAFHLHAAFEHHLMAALFKYTENDQEMHVVKYFLKEYDMGSDGQMSEKVELVHVGQWQQQEINGEQVISLGLPHWLNDDDMDDDERSQTPFLAIQDGAVRQGIMLRQGITEHKSVVINQQAMTQILTEFDPQNLGNKLAPKACDFDDDITPPEQGDAPVLVPDSANTLALADNSYVVTGKKELMLVSFDADGEVVVKSNHRDDDHDGPATGATSNGMVNPTSGTEPMDDVDVGSWVINADGQLLLDFDSHWVLLKVEQGLFSEQIKLVEQHEEADTVVFDLISPLSPDRIVAGETISLMQHDNCSLTLHLNPSDDDQGTGFIDASQCSDIKENMGDQFEVMWSLGDEGEVVLQPLDAAGEPLEQAIHLFTVTIDDKAHVLMTFSEDDDDEGHFELWKLIVAN